VLRDTLGDQSNENDRVTYIWLLTSAHRRLGQRVLSAIPFFLTVQNVGDIVGRSLAGFSIRSDFIDLPFQSLAFTLPSSLANDQATSVRSLRTRET
jgi:hypothetical protein